MDDQVNRTKEMGAWVLINANWYKGVNTPLTFALKLDPSHPYVEQRIESPAIVEHFGVGYCSRGSMKGRVCIPIHNVDGELVANAGR